MCATKRLSICLGLAAGLFVAALASAETFVADVRRDTEWLAGYASRVPGAPGHDEAQAALLERVRAVSGARVWVQEFPVLAPVVTRAELAVAEGPLSGSHAIFPIWPDLVRLKTTPAEGLAGQPAYVGAAMPTDLPARSLRGRIAVMEMEAYENWKQPFSMGAAAVLLLGSPDDRGLPPAQQPLHMPRYYVPEGPLADALRRGDIAAVTIRCDAEWRTVTARNIYALVKPRAGAAAPLQPLALAVPYDSMSIVMGLAPGADNAVDAAFLLNLLRETSLAPPARSLLFCFVDAYGFNQLGMRQLLALLTAVPDDETRQDYEKQDLERMKIYQEAALQIEELGSGEAALAALWDKTQYREIQRYVKDCLAPEYLQLRLDAGDLRLALYKASAADKPALQKTLDEKLARTAQINAVLSRMIARQPAGDDSLAPALGVWQDVRRRVQDQLAALRRQASRFEDFDQLRNAMLAELGGGTAEDTPAAFLIGTDLSDAGTSLGPGLTCKHLYTDETAPAGDFVRWLKLLFKNPTNSFWTAAPLAADTLNAAAVTSRDSPGSFNVGAVGLLTSPAASFRLPAVTWLTLDGMRRRVDTPQDRADRLDWSRLEPQVAVTRQLFKHLFDDPNFAVDPKKDAKRKSRWCLARGAVVTESIAETVARTPMPGFLATLVGGSNTQPGRPGAVGIRRNEFALTGADGTFLLPPLPSTAGEGVNVTQVQAFKLDARGRIVQSLSDSSSMIAGRLSSLINLGEGSGASPARVVAFDCVELGGPEFFDPRFLEPLSQYSFIDVLRGGTPKRYHFSMHEGQMSGLIAPDMRWQLILRAGTTANRLIMLNLDPEHTARPDASLSKAMQQGGFKPGEYLPSIPAHVSARDFFSIDEWRMSRFRRAGIASKAIDGLHAATKEMLAGADRALSVDDGAALHREAASALANEIRAYEAVRAMGNDVTRGGIFLMILLVPFAVAMERLLFACRGIGRRVVTCVCIFAVMTAILWSFHPSFRITSQPMIILMAFAILLLSLMVIVMILRKFEADMEDIRSGHAEASGAQTGRAGVIGSAIWLGIANMRKRKLRTTLTGTTIVLITFALLCFASSTHYQNRRQFKIDQAEAPGAGVLIHQPGMRALNPRSLGAVANLLQGEGEVVPRYWRVEPAALAWRLHVRHPTTGKQVSLKAGLGLAPGEQAISRPDRVMPNWERFSRGGACYLSASTAQSLGVKPGDTVLVAGTALELAGVFDPAAVDRELRMLDGQSLLPYDYTVEREDAPRLASLEAELAAGIGLAPESGVVHVPANDLVVLPAQFTLEIGGDLRSLALRSDSREAAEKTALKLMSILAFPMYYGEGKDVRVVVATPLIPKPPRNLLIPLVIAALIIFNTMLNSVAERKKEIHIYTSLGLAPRHVGMLFLAESATYGLMGSVFGYIVGQGTAKILTALDLMGGITLNYSGSNVVMTMGMVMGVVLLSAIVPAVMASRLATPSEDMKWKVPEPQNGVIEEQLPFTVTRAAAGGLMAFIYDFMEAHCDGGIGGFTADHLAYLPPAAGCVVGLRATTWLAPYDLGVRQDVRIEVREDMENICSIRVKLHYESGQTRTWWRLNKSFLDELRCQLLGWRNVKPERIMEYIRQAEGQAVAPRETGDPAPQAREPSARAAGRASSKEPSDDA